MRIQNNVTAVNSHRQYGINVNNQGKTMEKLSSGYRVNRAADDAAGLAISEKMRTQIRGLGQASRNTQDGISLLQVADGAMQLVSDILQRMRELAAQSANGTNDDDIDRNALNLEYQQLINELDQIADTTEFNGVFPLKGADLPIPKTTTLSDTGISSAQIPAYDLSVSNTQTTPVPAGAISGSLLTLTAPGNYYIDDSDLAGVSLVNLGAGVNLVITDNNNSGITGDLNFVGNGSARINTSITGDLTNSNTNGRVQVTGNVTGNVFNFGDMSFGPPTIPATVFTGKINNYGNMSFAHTGVSAAGSETFTLNSGNLRIGGTSVGVYANTGNIRYQPISPVTSITSRVATNNGRIEISSGSTVNPMLSNNGAILVETGGAVRGSGSVNNGLIEVAAGGIAFITTNSTSGRIISFGNLDLANQNGYVQVGLWNNGDIPNQGSTQGIAEIGTNNGTIRNFCQDFQVTTNNGTIDNYGTISNTPGGSGDIRHIARGVTTSITPDMAGLQEFRFWANGVQQDPLTATWVPVSGGYELVFDAPSVAGGDVVFSASSAFRNGTMTWAITDPVDPPLLNSSGSSGTSVTYFMEEPFPIQSGANEGDAIFLAFRALNAMNLGTEADSEIAMFDNLGESHIKTMDAAACALSVTLKAINDVSIYRAELGAQYNRLEYTYGNLNNSNENLSAAESRIRDADMAKEMTTQTKNSILMQSSTAMLAQANALPQGILQLLG